MALKVSGTETELREVVLKNKPIELVQASSKATVPVLVLSEATNYGREQETENGRCHVIDESLEIMLWALEKNDPDSWLDDKKLASAKSLISANDNEFKIWLDRYKYADRYPESTENHYFRKALEFPVELEAQLSKSRFLLGNAPTIADVAIFPFIRQFAFADLSRFANQNLSLLDAWLKYWLDSTLFNSCMHKYTVWSRGEKGVAF